MDINKVIIIVLLLVAVVGYIRLYRHYRRNIKKVTFLFDAIDNGDFSFNFPTEKGFKEDKILHKSLNRIKLFLQYTREEQMDREKYYEQILNAVDNVLANRTTQDLLYEVLLKCNLPLTLSIEEKKFGENTIYIVGSGMLAICLDKTIPQTIAEEIVKLRDEYAPIVPMQVVFRDNGFTDVAKTNVLQILQQAGFEDKSVQTI